MVTCLFFFFPKCHYGQSAYYSNILLCIFCILNASPDVISWSRLLCAGEELAPACAVRIAMQGHKTINPQPAPATPREHLLFPDTKRSCWEAKGDKPGVPNGSVTESICIIVCRTCSRLLPGMGVEEQEEDAEAVEASFLSPLVCSKQQLGGLCVASAHLSICSLSILRH